MEDEYDIVFKAFIKDTYENCRQLINEIEDSEKRTIVAVKIYTALLTLNVLFAHGIQMEKQTFLNSIAMLPMLYDKMAIKDDSALEELVKQMFQKKKEE